ncbi:MAG: citrate transporter [Lachnospiraceae bacterium]|nr:citrate transporter [Lachnospiraceae bacterium]
MGPDSGIAAGTEKESGTARRGWGRIAAFFRKETVLCVAAVLAAGSVCFVPPDSGYLAYPDYRVLALLFGLMLVVAGLQGIGLFRYLGFLFLERIRDTRQLGFLLMALCFFGSMFITNDVALITFVPFAVMTLAMAGQTKRLIPVVVLQTIAANLGSMLTPIGNPQNLYLYTAFDLSMGEFLKDMLPLALLSFVLLAAAAACLGRETLVPGRSERAAAPDRKKLVVYALLFLVCLACVLRLLTWPVMLTVLVLTVFFTDRKLFRQVDYFLLVTFLCFFLFIGNVGRIPAVSSMLRDLIEGRELPAGVALSQAISNVPAAILLSGFTDNVRPLLYGVNIGGLGTLIASLASVISYRLYGNGEGARKGAYLKTFTLYNAVFLAVLYAAALLLLRR